MCPSDARTAISAKRKPLIRRSHALYGVTITGDVELLFGPNVDRVNPTGYGDFSTNEFVVSGDDLYFEVSYAQGLGGGFTSFAYVLKLDQDGVVELVAELPVGIVLTGGLAKTCGARRFCVDPAGWVLAL